MAALYQFGRVAALSGERIERGMEALRKCLTLPPAQGSPGHEAAQWRLGNLWEKKGDKPGRPRRLPGRGRNQRRAFSRRLMR